MKSKLAAQEVELKSRSETTEQLLQNVGQETEKVGAEKEIADEEEQKVNHHSSCFDFIFKYNDCCCVT